MHYIWATANTFCTWLQPGNKALSMLQQWLAMGWRCLTEFVFQLDLPLPSLAAMERIKCT